MIEEILIKIRDFLKNEIKSNLALLKLSELIYLETKVYF